MSQPIDGDGQHADLLPVLQFIDAIAKEWFDRCNLLAKCRQAALPHLVGGALWNYEGALPVIFAIQHHQHSSSLDVPKCLAAVFRLAAEAHPHHVHRRTEVDYFKRSGLADQGVAAVRANGEVGSQFELAVRRAGDNAGDPAVFPDEAGYFGLHFQMKMRVSASMFRKEI